MALKGFAFLLGFFACAALLSAIATSASLVNEATFFEEKFALLEFRKAVGWDLRQAWSSLKSSVSGKNAQERAIDFSRKLALFTEYLATEYPVDVRFFPGLGLAPDLLRSALVATPFDCPVCRFRPGFFTAVLSGEGWAAVEVLA